MKPPQSLTRPFLPVLVAIAMIGGTPAQTEAIARPQYELRVELRYDAATLDVVQKTRLTNNTGVELPELVFQVTPAYFEAFTLHSARVDGAEVETSRVGTVLDLALGRPLPREGSAEVELRYTIEVPPEPGRFGRGEGILALGQFAPMLAVYTDGWDRHQYVDVGDAFYSEVSDFEVTVTSDRQVTIASNATGVRQGNVHTLRAKGVREFAMAVSDRFQTRSRDVDGVKLTAYGLSAPRLEVYLDAAEKTLRWFSANLAPYPYPTFTIAEMHDSRAVPIAQEFPGMVFLYSTLGSDGGGPGSYSEWLTGHEVGHQWFYGLVGNDQVRDPWLDEAMTTYADLLYYRDQYPRGFDYYFGRTVAQYLARAAMGGDRPVNTNVYDYPDDLPYFDVVYRKGTMFLNELRVLMGDEQFSGLLQDYVKMYSGKMATPRAFLDMAYQRGGEGVPPLVARYFSYGAFVDGKGYQLEVQWPERLVVAGDAASLGYSAGFDVAEAKVWLDNRRLYAGSGSSSLPLSLEGVEAGEYVLRVDLIDLQGALYQRATRVTVEK